MILLGIRKKSRIYTHLKQSREIPATLHCYSSIIRTSKTNKHMRVAYTTCITAIVTLHGMHPVCIELAAVRYIELLYNTWHRKGVGWVCRGSTVVASDD